MAISIIACGTNNDEEPATDTGLEDTETDEEMPDEASQSNDTEDVDGPTGEKIQVNFAVQEDPTPALDSIVNAFNEQNERYEVKPTIMENEAGQMHDQLLNSLSAGNGEYDVISMDVVWAREFATEGYLHPADKVIMYNFWERELFNSGLMESGMYNDKNYTLPYFPDLGLIYFRSDIVSEEDAAKLQSGDYTFDDLIKMGEKYKGEKDTKYAYAFQAKQYEGLTANINEFSSNWQDIEGGLQYMEEFIGRDLTPEDILNYTEEETANALLNGEAVFTRNWSYINDRLQSGEHDVKSNQVDYAPLPGGGTVGGWVLGINANTNELTGAKEFLAFIAGPSGQKINAVEGGYLPGYNPLLENDDVVESNNLLNSEGFQEAITNTIPRPITPNYLEVSDEIQNNTYEFLSGNKSLNDAANGIDEALEGEK